MSIQEILRTLGLWTLIGAVVFSITVIFLFRSNLVYAARTESGHFKEKMPIQGYLTTGSFLALIIGFLVMGNYFSIVRPQFQPSFWGIFGLNLGVMLLLVVYDSVVIDWVVIGTWRPPFLNLPPAMDREQMKVHLKRTLVASPIFSIALAGIASLCTYLLWIK